MATTMKLIAKTTLGSAAATITFDSIPGTYTDLALIISARTERAVVDTECYIKFNSSTSGYTFRVLYSSGSSVASTSGTSYSPFLGTGTTATSNTFASTEVYIPNYAGSTNKSLSLTSSAETNGANVYTYAVAGLWSNTAAITRIDLDVILAANFSSGTSAYLYGITKA